MPVTVHRSITTTDIIWNAAVAQAQERGFASTSSYVRFLIQEDVGGSSVVEMENKIETSLSNLSARLRSLGSMHQASFATLWALAELILKASPGLDVGTMRDGDDRVKQFRQIVSADIKNSKPLEGE